MFLSINNLQGLTKRYNFAAFFCILSEKTNETYRKGEKNEIKNRNDSCGDIPHCIGIKKNNYY